MYPAHANAALRGRGRGGRLHEGVAVKSYPVPMCAQCMMGATTAAAGVTGMRAWLAAKGSSWMTPRRLRFATISLIVAGFIGSAFGFHGT